VRDGFRLTGSDTGWWLFTITRSARSTAIPDLLALLMFYRGHRLFTEDVNLVRSYFKEFWRTDLLALTAPIALVRIDDDVPITGAILETIIGYHASSMLED
jgi:hypothetical protein